MRLSRIENFSLSYNGLGTFKVNSDRNYVIRRQNYLHLKISVLLSTKICIVCSNNSKATEIVFLHFLNSIFPCSLFAVFCIYASTVIKI